MKDNKTKDPIKIKKSNLRIIFSIKFFTAIKNMDRKNRMKSIFIKGNNNLG